MKRIGKTIGKICVGALAASLVPYRFRWEKATGSYQVASLLCSVKKTCGKERDNYEFVEVQSGDGSLIDNNDGSAII